MEIESILFDQAWKLTFIGFVRILKTFSTIWKTTPFPSRTRTHTIHEQMQNNLTCATVPKFDELFLCPEARAPGHQNMPKFASGQKWSIFRPKIPISETYFWNSGNWFEFAWIFQFAENLFICWNAFRIPGSLSRNFNRKSETCPEIGPRPVGLVSIQKMIMMKSANNRWCYKLAKFVSLKLIRLEKSAQFQKKKSGVFLWNYWTGRSGKFSLLYTKMYICFKSI